MPVHVWCVCLFYLFEIIYYLRWPLSNRPFSIVYSKHSIRWSNITCHGIDFHFIRDSNFKTGYQFQRDASFFFLFISLVVKVSSLSWFYILFLLLWFDELNCLIPLNMYFIWSTFVGRPTTHVVIQSNSHNIRLAKCQKKCYWRQRSSRWREKSEKMRKMRKNAAQRHYKSIHLVYGVNSSSHIHATITS